jgi:hypothetical protein
MSDGSNFGSSGGGLANLFQGIQNIAKAIGSANQTLSKSFPQSVGTSTSATGGAATLPANPVGFLTIVMPDGSSKKIPYYNT